MASRMASWEKSSTYASWLGRATDYDKKELGAVPFAVQHNPNLWIILSISSPLDEGTISLVSRRCVTARLSKLSTRMWRNNRFGTFCKTQQDLLPAKNNPICYSKGWPKRSIVNGLCLVQYVLHGCLGQCFEMHWQLRIRKLWCQGNFATKAGHSFLSRSTILSPGFSAGIGAHH